MISTTDAARFHPSEVLKAGEVSVPGAEVPVSVDEADELPLLLLEFPFVFTKNEMGVGVCDGEREVTEDDAACTVAAVGGAVVEDVTEGNGKVCCKSK